MSLMDRIVLALMLSTATPAPAQQAPQVSAAPRDDVVVEGYLSVRPNVRCEASFQPVLAAPRGDGEFNSIRHAFAQDRLKRIYLTCGEGSKASLRKGEEATELQAQTALLDGRNGTSPNMEPFPLGHSIYDRGAYTVQVIKRFAPDLTLTTEQTNDPHVQARFNAREVGRNRFCLPPDYRYFEVATCMVRVEPRLSVRLALTDGSARFGDVQAALIDRARVCVGGSRRVEVDPTQFRLYIADAVYRWTVAARGVDSLIPPAS
ncbi:MAG TPA: hypothetical protein VF695_16610 [Sphingomonas sp.]|jgi:hypothetical protein